MRLNKQLARNILAGAVAAVSGLPLLGFADKSLTVSINFPKITEPSLAAQLTQSVVDQFYDKSRYTVSAITDLTGTTITVIKRGIYDVYWTGNSSSQTCSTNNPDWTISKGVPETFTVQCSQGDGHTDFINTVTLNLVSPKNPHPSVTIVTHDTFRHKDVPTTYPCSVGRGVYGIKNVSYEDTKKLYWFAGNNGNGYLQRGGGGCSFPGDQ